MMKFKSINLLYFLVIFALLCFLHLNNFLDSDEGYTLAGAWNLYNGVHIYTGFFTYVPPGSFYLLNIVWKIFGPSYLVAKVASILLFAFGLWGIKRISELYLSDFFSFIPPVLYLLSSSFWPLINHNTYNLVFIIWSIYFILKGIDKGSKNDFLFAGLFLGASLWFLQHKTIIIFLFLFVYFFILLIYKLLSLKNFFIFNFAFLLITLPIPLIWPLYTLYQNLVIFPLTRYFAVNQVSWRLLCVCGFIYLSSLLIIFWQNRNQKDTSIWHLAGLQFVLFITALTRPDKFHVLSILFPLLIMLIFILIFLFKNKKRLLFFIVFATLAFMLYFSTKPIKYLLYMPSISSANVVTSINKLCSESKYIYAGPFLPNIYFESKKINPTRYLQLVTGFHTTEMFNEAKADIAKAKPSCAVLNYDIVKKFGHDKNNPVDQYIDQNYKLAEILGNIQIFKVK